MWDERYGADQYFYGTEPNDYLARTVSGLSPGRALCLADGEGRNGVFLAGLGYEVTSVDQSAVGLEKASRLAGERGVKLTTVVADLSNYDLGTDSWDLIVSMYCHLPSAIREDLHGRIPPALRRGGMFVLEAFNPDQLRYDTGGPRRPDMLMTAEGLVAELTGLRIDRCEQIEREVNEGAGHSGRAAVVQLTGHRE